MKLYLLISQIFFILFISAPWEVICQTRLETIADDIYKERLTHSSLSYTVNFRVKPFSHDDTLKYTAHVELVRIPDDTLFHGLVYIDMDSIWYGYNLQKIFYGNKKTSTIIYDSACLNPDLYIKGSVINDLVDESFLNLSNGLHQILNDPSDRVMSHDTLMDGVKYLGIFIHFPEDEKLNNKQYYGAIDIATSTVRRKTYSVFFQGNEQYQAWDYSNIKYGNETHIPKLEMDNVSDYLKNQKYIGRDIKQDDLLKYDFSNLKGQILNKDGDFQLKNIDAKFIVLDFWYTSCFPCIKSIPAMDSIAQTYKDRNVIVMGANMVDDPVKNKSRLDKFMVNNPMSYETIMLDHKLNESILLQGYPTFIILDNDFQVIYHETGFSPNHYLEISEFLNSRLKK